MKMVRFIFSVCFFLMAFEGQSQTKSDIFSKDINRAGTSFGNELSAFFRLKQPGYAYFGAPLLFCLATPFDESVRDYSKSWHGPVQDKMASVGYIYGRPETSLIFSSVLYTQGLTTGNDVNRKIGSHIFQSFFYSAAVVGIGKVVFGRKRPYNNDGPYDFWNSSFTNDDVMSHPSGHSAFSFGLSTTLAHYSNTPMKIDWYGLAVNTVLSRIYQDDHWLSDVLVGSFIGTAFSLMVFNQSDNVFQPGETITGGQLSVSLTSSGGWNISVFPK